ncbi:MAG: hypothetical protein HQL64_14725 [Magnetococcales bacterium]|nr:hypothetical protein [Magnetococcales bacterium]
MVGLLPTVQSAIAQAADLTVVYSGNLEGHLEPCGCAAESDFGGLDRHAVWLDRFRTERPEAVVIANGGLLVGGGTTERVKAEFILRGFALLRYDALGLQWSDLAFGRDFLATPPLPWVASNWRDAGFKSSQALQRGSRKVLFLSWLDPAAAPKTAGGNPIYPLEASMAALAEQTLSARKEGFFVILATALDLSRAKQLPLAGVDLVLLQADETMGNPVRIQETLAVRPGKWGMRLGVLDVQLNAEGRIVDWQHQVADLGADLGHSPRMAPWYTAYTDRVRTANQERIAQLRTRRQGDAGSFVGADKCQSCHERQYQSWQASAHARALPTLERVSKDFDPDCLICHTVGLTLPGGFIDKGVTPHLAGVQCESCHGPGREHVTEGGSRKMSPLPEPTEALCRGCHNALHAPAFEFKHFRQRGIPCG